jgi:type I restriction enzyme, S subunit
MKWKTKPLAAVADFRLGKMLDDKKNKGEPLPYLANINVRWGECDLEHLREMRFAHDEMDRYGLKYGDIVMCEGGEPGRCAIWKEAVPGMMIQKALHRIRPHDCLDHRFLFYSFLHKGRTGSFAPLFTGATIKHLPREKLAKVEIAFPRLDVQRRIADILSAYDDLIENNRRRIQLLEQSARLLYKEWFVRLRFPGYAHVKIKDGVPEGWEKVPLGDVLILQRGFDLPLSARKPGEIPIIASTGINGFHREAKVRGPGVVTGRSGSLGKVIYVHHDYWPLNTTLWVKEFKKVFPLTAYFLLSSLKLEQYNGGVAVPTLNRNDVHKIEILCPPKQVQLQFIEFVLPLYEKIRVLEKQNGRLANARDLLLPRLMNGEIEV